MIRQIKKRDGRIESFDQEKIKNAIWKAAKAVGGTNEAIAEDLADQVVEIVSARFTDSVPEVEDIQDTVEKVLIENGHARTAKAFILYREKRRATREINAMIGATIDIQEGHHFVVNAPGQQVIDALGNHRRDCMHFPGFVDEGAALPGGIVA